MSLNRCGCDLKTTSVFVASLYMLFSSMSVLTHILLFFSREEIGDEEVAYSTASGLALSAVSAVTTGLLVYGVIQENRFTLIPWLVYHAVVLAIFALILFFLPLIFALLLLLFVGSVMIFSWYTIFKYFRSLDPHNPQHQPQTTVYVQPLVTTGFVNRDFVPDKPSQPDTVVFTPGLPSYQGIVGQPHNV